MSSPNRALSEDFKSAQQYVDRLKGKGHSTPVDLDCSYEMKLPDYFDAEKFRKSQLAFRQDGYSILSCTMVGMMAMLSMPDVLSVLKHTKQSDTPQLAYRRYVSTVQHTISWGINELKPGSKSWKSLEMVRKRHVLSSRSSAAASNGIISQSNMALLQFALVGYKLNDPVLFSGRPISRETFDGFAYFWRVIGHMLGIQDEYNLFSGSHQETVARLTLVQEQIMRPNMIAADGDDFNRLSEVLVDGLAAFNPLLSPKSFLYFCRMANGCPGYDYWTDGGRLEHLHAMSWWDRWLLWQQMVVHRYVVRAKVTRIMLNLWTGALFLMVMFAPALAVWRFGWRGNYVRIMRGSRR